MEWVGRRLVWDTAFSPQKRTLLSQSKTLTELQKKFLIISDQLINTWLYWVHSRLSWKQINSSFICFFSSKIINESLSMSLFSKIYCNKTDHSPNVRLLLDVVKLSISVSKPKELLMICYVYIIIFIVVCACVFLCAHLGSIFVLRVCLNIPNFDKFLLAFVFFLTIPQFCFNVFHLSQLFFLSKIIINLRCSASFDFHSRLFWIFFMQYRQSRTNQLTNMYNRIIKR